MEASSISRGGSALALLNRAVCTALGMMLLVLTSSIALGDEEAVLEQCDSPKGTIAVAEPQSHVIMTLSRYNLPPPTSLLRQYIQNSNCFQVVERGRAMRNIQQERSLSESGMLQQDAQDVLLLKTGVCQDTGQDNFASQRNAKAERSRRIVIQDQGFPGQTRTISYHDGMLQQNAQEVALLKTRVCQGTKALAEHPRCFVTQERDLPGHQDREEKHKGSEYRRRPGLSETREAKAETTFPAQS